MIIYVYIYSLNESVTVAANVRTLDNRWSIDDGSSTKS